MSYSTWEKTSGGLSCERIFFDSEVEIFKGVLSENTMWRPDIFEIDDRVQMFLFLNESGYIVTDSKAWNIEDGSFFVPNFKKEEVFIKATDKPLKFVLFRGHMNEYDVRTYTTYHMMLPRFIRYDKAFSYIEDHSGLAGSAIRTANLVVETAFGRWFCGLNYGTGGDEFMGEHVHPEYDQWTYALPETDFIYHIGNETRVMKSGDIVKIPMGTPHSIERTDEGKIKYLWFKCATNGFTIGRDGDMASES